MIQDRAIITSMTSSPLLHCEKQQQTHHQEPMSSAPSYCALFYTSSPFLHLHASPLQFSSSTGRAGKRASRETASRDGGEALSLGFCVCSFGSRDMGVNPKPQKFLTPIFRLCFRSRLFSRSIRSDCFWVFSFSVPGGMLTNDQAVVASRVPSRRDECGRFRFHDGSD